MNDTTWQRPFGFRHAFDHPVTVVVTLTAVALLVLAPPLMFITTRAAKSTAEKRAKPRFERPRGGCTIRNLRFCISLQLLRQIGRNVRDDQSIIVLISQFQEVTDPMNLCDQRAFVRRNPKPRAQSP